MANKQLVLLELNEINFDIARRYFDENPAAFPALQRLVRGAAITTASESAYEELEPWIQWVSVHTGLTYPEHKVFRLGDIVKCGKPQIFETLEGQGLSVGGISAMNAENRLHAPKYFIPDPWTETTSDGSWWSRRLHSAIAQAVNDNSKAKVTPASLLTVALATLRFARPRNYGTYIRLLARAKGAPWRKALFLDLLLSDIHAGLRSRARPNFSCLFLNAGAHIQHHYFHSSPFVRDGKYSNPDWYIDPAEDPIREMLVIYEQIIANLLSEPDVDFIVATGLSQKPYDRTKFYYRLRDHADFLRQLGLRFSKVQPRMTRDFLVEFDSEADAATAQTVLSRLTVEGGDEPLFGEMDLKGRELFVTLTYPAEVTEKTRFLLDSRAHPLAPHVVFVSVKNGMHQGKGFAFFTGGVAPHAPRDGSHVKSLYDTVMAYFGLDRRPA